MILYSLYSTSTYCTKPHNFTMNNWLYLCLQGLRWVTTLLLPLWACAQLWITSVQPLSWVCCGEHREHNLRLAPTVKGHLGLKFTLYIIYMLLNKLSHLCLHSLIFCRNLSVQKMYKYPSKNPSSERDMKVMMIPFGRFLWLNNTPQRPPWQRHTFLIWDKVDNIIWVHDSSTARYVSNAYISVVGITLDCVELHKEWTILAVIEGGTEAGS